jgi:hypothetical protein
LSAGRCKSSSQRDGREVIASARASVIRFRKEVRELTSRTRGVSIEPMAEELAPIYGAGSAILVNAKGRACCRALRNGPGAGCGRRFRSSGSAGRDGLGNCGTGERVRTWPLKRPVVPVVLTALGVCSPALALALPNAFFALLGIPSLTVRRKVMCQRQPVTAYLCRLLMRRAFWRDGLTRQN